MKKTVVIGSDHAGFSAKSLLIERLKEYGCSVEDLGAPSQAPADFAPIARKVAQRAAEGEAMGILLCGTGIGMSIMANKVDGVRAALVHDLFSAKAARLHNDSNVLCMGARIVAPEMMLEIARVWLETEFAGGKHARRIQWIKAYENARQQRRGG